jgi:general secretion pathway protein N
MKRWWLAGSVLGAALALVVFAPAAWLAAVVERATSGHLVLAQARGTVWQGSAVPTLTGGLGSKDASALPGRLHWTLATDGLALVLRARHACCLEGEQALRIVPGLERLRIEFKPTDVVSGALGHWPAAWLNGLGTPWNTLQPTGELQVTSPGLALESSGGRWLFSGRADIELNALSSRISTLPVLGSYKLMLSGDHGRNEPPSMLLSTLSGALQLNGNGQWAGSKFRFRGQASASPGSEAALSNLLNIIGRRQGAIAAITIG